MSWIYIRRARIYILDPAAHDMSDYKLVCCSVSNSIDTYKMLSFIFSNFGEYTSVFHIFCENTQSHHQGVR